MFVASLVIHGLLLLIPKASEPQTLEQPEEEAIDIVALPPAGIPLPETTTPDSDTPSEVAEPAEAPMSAAPTPANRPPAIEPAPQPEEEEEPPEEESDSLDEEDQDEEESVSDDINDSQDESVDDENGGIPVDPELASRINGFLTSASGQVLTDQTIQDPTYNLEPEQYAAFFTSTSLAAFNTGTPASELEYQEGISTFIPWIPGQASSLYRQLSETLSTYQFAPYGQNVGEYGGADLYEMRNGENVEYLSLIRNKIGGVTFVFWNQDPRTLSGE
jgi:hypothetical protein